MRVVFCTTPVDEADKIANTLVEEELVACVNVIPKVKSHYKWKGEVCHDEEALLIIKTTEKLIPQLTERINAVHPYETVEIIALPITEGDSDYLKWIESVTKKG